MADVNATFYAKDIVTIAALALGPVIAVWLTLWHQVRSEKRAAKTRLFITLMAHRKSNPPASDWANSLNLIDVVYADRPKVVALWHSLYEVLVTTPWNQQRYTHAYLEMLSAMAKSIGYKTLTQTDLDKFYVPGAHEKAVSNQVEVQAEFLRVLKATKHMGTPNPDM